MCLIALVGCSVRVVLVHTGTFESRHGGRFERRHGPSSAPNTHRHTDTHRTQHQRNVTRRQTERERERDRKDRERERKEDERGERRERRDDEWREKEEERERERRKRINKKNSVLTCTRGGMYTSVSLFCTFSHEKTQSGTRALHDMCCSKPLTFHNGFMILASRSCFKHLFRFQALHLLENKKSLKSEKVLETAARSNKHETIVESQRL